MEYDTESLIDWNRYKNLILDEYIVPKTRKRKFVKSTDKDRTIREFVNYYGFINNNCFFGLKGSDRNVYESLCYGLSPKLFFVFTGVFCNRISWSEFKKKINKRSSMVYFENCGEGTGFKNIFKTKKPFYPTSLKVVCGDSSVLCEILSDTEFKMCYFPCSGESVYATYRSSVGMNFDITDNDYLKLLDTVYTNILSINDKISKKNIEFEDKNSLKKYLDRMNEFLGDEEITMLYLSLIVNMDLEKIAFCMKKDLASSRVKYDRAIEKIYSQEGILSLGYMNSKVICINFLTEIGYCPSKISKIIDENYDSVKKIVQRCKCTKF